MKLRLVSARVGAQWVRRGFAIFFKQPMAFAGLFASFLFGVFALSLLPFIGQVLLLVALPLASLGFMLATRTALDGRFPLPTVFALPLRGGKTQLLTLLKLGLLYAAATWALMWLADLIDGGALSAWIEAQASNASSPDVTAAKLADPQLETSVLLRVGLLAVLALPFWHAPALVYWGRQSAAKALFFSTVACWRNKGAFLVYGLTWLGVLMLFGLLANLIFGLIGRGQYVAFIAMPVSLLIWTVFYASLYFTFADCFEPNPPQSLDEAATAS